MNDQPQESSKPFRDADPTASEPASEDSGAPESSTHSGVAASPSAASIPPKSAPPESEPAESEPSEPAPPEPAPPEADPAEAMSLGRKIGLTIVIVLAVLFGVFAVGNSHHVTFSWVFGATEARVDAAGNPVGGVPLIVLLIAALVIGVVIGALLGWQFLRSRRQKAAAKHEAKIRKHT